MPADDAAGPLDAAGYSAERAQSFGSAAELYDRRRPSYPAAAVDHILGRVEGAADVVDIGAGTGKAAALFASRGLRVTAVEPDARMAEVLRAQVPTAEVVVAAFESWEAEPASFDVAVSAQAWHWVDRSAGMPKLAAVLRPGGVMAVMANVPRDGGMDLAAALEPVYQAIVPDMPPDPMRNWSGEWQMFIDEFEADGRFDVEPRWELDWDEPLDADAFAELAATHSTYRVLGDDVRARLTGALREAVAGAGGVVTMWYRTAVLVARLRD